MKTKAAIISVLLNLLLLGFFVYIPVPEASACYLCPNGEYYCENSTDEPPPKCNPEDDPEGVDPGDGDDPPTTPPDDSYFTVQEVDLSDTKVPVNEEVTVDYVLKNTGEDAGTSEIYLAKDQDTSDNTVTIFTETEREVTLNADESKSGTYSYTPSSTGYYGLGINTKDEDLFKMLNVTQPSNFEIGFVDNNGPVHNGRRAEVAFFVENTGKIKDTQTIKLKHSSTVVDQEEDVTLDPGESIYVDLGWQTSYPENEVPGDKSFTVTTQDDFSTV